MSPQMPPAIREPNPPPPAIPRFTAAQILGWGSLRTALSFFAVGWVLLQTAAGHLLLLGQFGAELEPVFVQLVKLVLTLAYGAGAVYFLTGMGMSCTVPAETGARRFAWGIIGCLVLSGAAWLLFDAAAYHNEQVVEEIVAEMRQAQRENPKDE